MYGTGEESCVSFSTWSAFPLLCWCWVRITNRPGFFLCFSVTPPAQWATESLGGSPLHWFSSVISKEGVQHILLDLQQPLALLLASPLLQFYLNNCWYFRQAIPPVTAFRAIAVGWKMLAVLSLLPPFLTSQASCVGSWQRLRPGIGVTLQISAVIVSHWIVFGRGACGFQSSLFPSLL